jgi:hypothetical protein
VVQTLVDFSRPVEVKLIDYDLRHCGDVVTLAAAEMSTRQVTSDQSASARVSIGGESGCGSIEAGSAERGAEWRTGHAGWRKASSNAAGRGQVSGYPGAGSGEGISEELREKIFDLYFTTKKGGSGIGLAMTYRILQLHHGSIDVQSEIGRGSVFQLRIPLSATDRGRRHPQPAVLESVKGLEG